VRVTSELSLEKTSYTSTSTSLILSRGVPAGISPTIVALSMTVVSCRTKSSAVSVSILPGLGGRENAPSCVVGLPVEKKNGTAQRGVAKSAATANAIAITLLREITILFGVFISFKKFSNLFIFPSFLAQVNLRFSTAATTSTRLVRAAQGSHNPAVNVR